MLGNRILTGTHLGGGTRSTPEVSKARKRFLVVASAFLAEYSGVFIEGNLL